MINNGDWTEGSAIWSEIIRVIRFEITSMISDQNCRTQFQSPLYYTHFEITLFFVFLPLLIFIYPPQESRFLKKPVYKEGCDLEQKKSAIRE